MEKIKKNSSKVVFLAVIVLVCSWAILSDAGSLNPSAPPAPTMHTLEDIYNEVGNIISTDPRVNVQSLPSSSSAIYVISQSGSYYLTDNITGETDKHGIEITANDVTIDLNGYALIGQGKTDGTTGHGIIGPGRICVMNGSIINWREDGINLGHYSRISNITVADCGGNGICVGDYGANIKRCTSSGNNLIGIYAGENSTISDCTAKSNSGIGIQVGPGSSITQCIASWNGGSCGIYADSGSSVFGCTAQYNTSDGIWAWEGSVVNSCTSSRNFDDGIEGRGEGVTIVNCNSFRNTGTGIEAENSLVLGNCSVRNTPNLGLTNCTNLNNRAP